MENEKISIIMGIYNCGVTLSEAIESIINQTYTNWELILCDDASTDNTYEVAQKYQKAYPDRIILLRNKKNMRLSYSLNKCLKYATGKYIARMDGDDISSPNRFQKQISFLNANKEIDLVGTAMQQFNESGYLAVIEKPIKIDKYSLRKIVPFNHATILTYKYVYDKLKGYTVSDRTSRCEDYDLWFRFFHAGFNGANMKEPLYFVREDMAALKRRTFKARWNGFKTTVYGFKLLGFPKRWLIIEFFKMILKSIIPSNVMLFYRSLNRRTK